MPDDLPAMNAVANAVRFADGEEWVTSDEQFTDYYQHLSNCDPATDILIAMRGPRMVGYGRASWHDQFDGPRLYEPTVFTLPDEGAALLDAVMEAIERRCREIASTHPAGPKLFDTEAVVSLIAPRPALFLTGELDAGSPADGIRVIEERAGGVYKAIGAGDKFRSVRYPDVGHTYTPEMRKEVLTWFEKWLGR